MNRTIARATQATYEHAVKPLLFRRDAERVHEHMTAFGAALGRSPWARRALTFAYAYANPLLAQTVAGLRFPNPIGLAAGFDKNGRLADVLPAVGFGFVEVGSVTAEPCAGNPKPRVWRLPESRSLQIHIGLANDGAETVAARIPLKPHAIPIGMSVAKTNCARTVSRDAGIADYLAGIRAVTGVADYCTINVSCPNAYGGEPFTEPAALRELLAAVAGLRLTLPVFLKFPCDLGDAEFDALMAAAAGQSFVTGIIVSNLTKDRGNSQFRQREIMHAPPRGGFSGKPVEARANALLARAYRAYGARFVLMGCGGVFTAADAYAKIRAGASLIQLITGMVFQGPSLIGQLNSGLVDLLRRDGYAEIREAVGSGVS